MTQAATRAGGRRRPAGARGAGQKEKPLKRIICDAADWMILVFLIGFAGAIPFQQAGSVLMEHESLVRLALYALILVRCLFCLPEDVRLKESEIPVLLAVAATLAAALPAGRVNVFYSIVRVYAPVLAGLAVMMTAGRKEIGRFLRKFVAAVTVIAGFSVLFWGAGSILHLVSPGGTVSFLWDGEHTANSYWHLYYEPDWQYFHLLGRDTYKNCGIFAEPPMFGFLLCLAWMFHRLEHGSFREGWIVYPVLGAAIFSTWSVTAIVAILLFEAVQFGLRKTGDGLKTIAKFFLFLGLAFIALTYAADLVEDKLSSGSGGVRRAHLEVSLKTFLEHPLTGLGFGRSQVLEAASGYKQGMSIGLPAVWALGGIGTAALTLVPFAAAGIRAVRDRRWKLLAFDVSLFWISVCTMIFFTMPFAWLILMYLCRDEGPGKRITRTRRGRPKIEGRRGK